MDHLKIFDTENHHVQDYVDPYCRQHTYIYPRHYTAYWRCIHSSVWYHDGGFVILLNCKNRKKLQKIAKKKLQKIAKKCKKLQKNCNPQQANHYFQISNSDI